ncbi:MAG: glycerophosphoryl diester phosphodiesterase [Alphaproteobacteria bacterium]|nr:glycerophosphoryl diester phosphodiesterase [Alphaproteobacteria bacterium]
MISQLRWPRLIGHRGAAKWAPENTLASFFCAADLGAEWVELDVRLCKGGIPVVFHDETLERTTNGLGRVAQHRLDELKSLDAGTWFSPRFRDEPIPTLEEALSTIARLGMEVNIELKPDQGEALEMVQAALAVAKKVWPETAPPPLISSFSHEVLALANGLCPWPIGYLAERFDQDLLERARSVRAASLNLNANYVQPSHISAIHDAGMAVLAYTVNDPTEARRLWAMGVDSIFTDDPKSLSEG